MERACIRRTSRRRLNDCGGMKPSDALENSEVRRRVEVLGDASRQLRTFKPE